MPQPHIIRLRARWEFVANTPGGEMHGNVDATGDWLASLPAGATSVSYWRRFHSPTGLTPDTRVLLVVNGVTRLCQAELNNHPLATCEEPFRWDITSRLQTTNVLTLSPPEGETSFAPEIWIEIHAS
jgi:hypothetical protein